MVHAQPVAHHSSDHLESRPSIPLRSTREGFTLIELLIVLAIISALMALGMVVGRQVVTGSKSRVTQQLIYNLDQSLDSYVSDKGEMPPPVYTLTIPETQRVFDFPAIDARPDSTQTFTDAKKYKDNWFSYRDATVPSLATYAAVLKQSGLSESILKSIPSKFVNTRFLDHWYDGSSAKENPNTAAPYAIDILTAADAGTDLDVASFEILDAWGRPIRFVHPGYRGKEFYDGPSGDYYDAANKIMTKPNGETRPFFHQVYARWGDPQAPISLRFRRSYSPFKEPTSSNAEAAFMTGDSDEGICPTRRPYFYSPGADGDPGRRADNVYTTMPDFPEETAAFDSTDQS